MLVALEKIKYLCRDGREHQHRRPFEILLGKEERQGIQFQLLQVNLNLAQDKFLARE